MPSHKPHLMRLQRGKIITNPSMAVPFCEGVGNAADASGTGLVGSVDGATWTSGEFCTALYFDGSDDSVSFPNSNAHNITSGDWTICFRAKFHSLADGGGTIATVIGNGTYDANGFYCGSVVDGGMFLFVGRPGETGYAYANAGTLSANLWYSICIVVVSGYAYFFVNGVVAPGGVGPVGSMASTSDNLLIAKHGTGFANITVSDMRIYKRALGTTEVSLYHSLFG